VGRKITVILLVSTLICLGGLTSVWGAKTGPVLTFKGMKTAPWPEKYNEPPMLKTKVAAGILPPVEERLPEEPLVVEPIEEIGQYGGTLQEASLGPGTMWDPEHGMIEQYMFQVDNTCTKVLPDVAKAYELSEDKKTLTIYLRKGMKWSDGAPFTADDIMFWWEDEANNKELSPAGPPTWWRIGGEFPKFEKVDDYTIRLRFPKPYPCVLGMISNWQTVQNLFYDPKHYLKKWHIKYNPNADELAKKEGYDHWWQAYPHHRNCGWSAWDHVGVPVVSPWMLEKITPTARIWVRNPYFYAVDTAGNQLPYIDKVVVTTCGDQEMVNMKTIAGELSFSGMMLSMDNYPLYQENAEKGDYRVLLWKLAEAEMLQFSFNLNHPDPVLRKIFQDIRFRRAMSLAINRDEINEVAYYGMAVPCQSTVSPDCSFYKKEWAEAYAQYDPEQANKLLDEMGLRWDEQHQYRLRPDGKTLSVTIEMVEGLFPGMTKVCELIKEYWGKVGVKVNLKTVERAFHGQRIEAGVLDVGMWHSDRMEELRCYMPRATKFNPRSEMSWAVQWGLWRDTGGKSGEEPPEEWKRQWERMDRWYTAATREEYIRLAQEIFDFFAEQLVCIGTVGYGPAPIVVKNNLRNVVEKALYGDGPNWDKSVFPMQWFFKK